MRANCTNLKKTPGRWLWWRWRRSSRSREPESSGCKWKSARERRTSEVGGNASGAAAEQQSEQRAQKPQPKQQQQLESSGSRSRTSDSGRSKSRTWSNFQAEAYMHWTKEERKVAARCTHSNLNDNGQHISTKVKLKKLLVFIKKWYGVIYFLANYFNREI